MGRTLPHPAGLFLAPRTNTIAHCLALANRVQAAARELWGRGGQDRTIQVLAEGAMAEPERPELPLAGTYRRLLFQH